jgi:hypothetical protein
VDESISALQGFTAGPLTIPPVPSGSQVFLKLFL